MRSANESLRPLARVPARVVGHIDWRIEHDFFC